MARCLRMQIFTTFGAGLLLSSAVMSAACAADASPWDGDKRSAARLIAGMSGSGPGARTLRAGIQIRLGTGWKTYWRYPGDAGVPPLFDFSRSENVEAVTVLWPAPQRFLIEGLTMIGYSGSLIFPLRVIPRKTSDAVILRLKLNPAAFAATRVLGASSNKDYWAPPCPVVEGGVGARREASNALKLSTIGEFSAVTLGDGPDNE